MYITRCFGVILSLLLLSQIAFPQQLKLGKFPYDVEKSAVLELKSDNQGLLLPRIADTALINTLSPPDGMAIFFIPTSQLLLRANGHWEALGLASSLNNYWSVNGNSNGVLKQFGNIDNYSLPFITNNTERMRIDSIGNIGIGTSAFDATNPEKLLIDAGTTTSFNLLAAKGSIDNYLQLNIQNRSNGTTASSDIVATADNGTESLNYIDMGINSSGFTNPAYPVISGINNAYLYSTGNDFIIGNAIASKNLKFFTGGYAAINERMRIDGNGLVGIGVTAPTAILHLKAGTATANTAPLKFTSGALMTTAAAGAVEFLTDKFYGTIATGAARKEFTLNNATLTTARVPFATTNGRLTDLAAFTYTTNRLSPTYITLGAGAAAAGSAPLVFTSGVSLTTPIAGAMEFTTDNPTFTIATGVSRKQFTLNDAALTSGRVPYTTTNGRLIDNVSMTYAGNRLSPTYLTLAAGTAAVGTAPLVMTTGVNLTTPLAGAIEFDGTHFYGTVGATRYQFDQQTGTTYTGSNGITLSGNDFRNDLITGIAGGQTITGGTAAGNSLTLSSTNHATKGNIVFGTSVYDEVNNRLGIGNSIPSEAMDVTGNLKFSGALMPNNNAGTLGYLLRSNGAGTSPSWINLGLSNLSDAAITSPANGQILQYNGTSWINSTPAYLTTIDTSNISNFYQKVRGLISGTAPITFNAAGQIGIIQATTSTNGYLSNTDWNTFNSKGSGNGTVTSASVVTANGVSGIVATATTTPAITLTLGAITPASVAATGTVTGSNLSGTNTGNVTIGTANGLSLAGQALSQALASTSVTGALSNTDWNTFNSKGSGNGTVTSASVVTANGVSGTVATATTTPAITLTLGAITPTSVAATGTVTGSNLSGTNTGNVTIGTANGLSLAGQALSQALASTSVTGALSNTDWNTFNNKLSTIDTTNIASFSQKVRSLFSGTAPVTYSNGLIGITQATTSTNGYLNSTDWNTFNNKASASNIWSLTGNSGIDPATNFIGTTDNKSLRFRTNNTERFIIDSIGRVGIGVTNPTNPLVVKDTLEIRRVGSLSQLLFSNTAGTGDFRIGGDGGDIFWQGGGGRALQMGSHHTTILGGDRQIVAFPAYTGNITNTGVLVKGQRDVSVPLAIQGNSATQTANLTEWRNSSGTALNVIDQSGRMAIGATTFNSTNPEKLLIDAGSTGNTNFQNVIVGKGNTNSYAQLNIQNGNAGTSASSDVVATADNGNESVNFVDMGINSSVNSQNYFGGLNDAYLYAIGNGVNAGGNLYIGTATASRDIAFLTGGGTKSSGLTMNNERMRILGTGNVGIANGSPTEKLDITGNLKFSGALMPGGTAGTTGQFLVSTGSGSAPTWFDASGYAWLVGGNNVSSELEIGTTNDFALPFITNNTEKMRISSTGNVGIGTSSFDGTDPEKLLIDAGVTSSFNLINARGNINNYLQFNIQNESSGLAASTDIVATNNTGTETARFIDMGINSSGYSNAGILGGANNAYLYSTGSDLIIGNATAAEPIRFFTGGTATSNERMRIDGSGNVGIGTTSSALPLSVEESGGTVASFNRTSNDGTIISLRQAGTEEGTISVSGATVSYNAFTGSHYAWTNETIEKGTLVTLTGNNQYFHDNKNSEIIYGMRKSAEPNDPKIMGAYLGLQESSKPYDASNPNLVMAVGNGVMWVVDKGENIEIGDYLISSDVSGHAMRDNGSYPTTYVIARVAESVNWAAQTEMINGVKHKLVSVFFESFVRNNAQKELEDMKKEMKEMKERIKQLENKNTSGQK